MPKIKSSFARSSVLAVDYCSNLGLSPLMAWRKATMEIFGDTPGQKRGAPKAIFLSLCEEGLVRGIPKGNYSRAHKTKLYALKAIQIIKNSKKEFTPIELWNKVQNKGLVNHYHMDVVLGLYENNLLRIEQ